MESLQRQRMVRPVGRGAIRLTPDRRRAGCDVCGRVRWLDAAARDEHRDDIDDSTHRRRTGDDTRPRIRPDPIQQACVVWHEERPWLRADRRVGPVLGQLGLEPPRRRLAAAGRSTARAGAHPGGRERDQGGHRTVDRDEHRQHPDLRRRIRSALRAGASRCHPGLRQDIAHGIRARSAAGRCPPGGRVRRAPDAHPAVDRLDVGVLEAAPRRRSVAGRVGRSHPRRLVQSGLLHLRPRGPAHSPTGARPPPACRSWPGR